MSEYKAGARVKILDDNETGLEKGSIHTIDYIDTDGDVIIEPYWFYKNQLEVIDDNVNSPSHYQFPGGVEVIQITEHLNFCKGNAVKYLTRSGRKAIADEVEDLEKAIWYIQREITRIKAQDAESTV